MLNEQWGSVDAYLPPNSIQLNMNQRIIQQTRPPEVPSSRTDGCGPEESTSATSAQSSRYIGEYWVGESKMTRSETQWAKGGEECARTETGEVLSFEPRAPKRSRPFNFSKSGLWQITPSPSGQQGRQDELSSSETEANPSH